MGPKQSKESQEGDPSPWSAAATGGLKVPKQMKAKKIGDYLINEDENLGSGAKGGTFLCCREDGDAFSKFLLTAP